MGEVRAGPAHRTPHAGLLSVITRSVQLASAVIDFNAVVQGPARWTMYLNVRRADAAHLASHDVAGIRVPAGPDRCFERHLQLLAAFDASGSDEGAAWQVGRDLDLGLAQAYGFTERRVHDAGGDLPRGVIT